MMNKLKVILSVLLFSVVASATPEDSSQDLGVGLLTGSETGVTATKWTSHNRAFDIAYGATGENESQLHADHLWYLTETNLPARITPYVGAGLGIGMDRVVDDVKREADGFARIPVGASWFAQNYPIGVFAEVAPSMIITPATEGYLDAALGARYFF